MPKLLTSLFMIVLTFALIAFVNITPALGIFPTTAFSPDKIITYQFGYLIGAFMVFGVYAMVLVRSSGATAQLYFDLFLFWALLLGNVFFCRVLTPNVVHQFICITIAAIVIAAVQKYMKNFSFYGEKGITT